MYVMPPALDSAKSLAAVCKKDLPGFVVVTFKNTNSVPGGALTTWFVRSVYEDVFLKQQTKAARVGDIAHWLRLTSKYSVVYAGAGLGVGVTIGVVVSVELATGVAGPGVKA